METPESPADEWNHSGSPRPPRILAIAPEARFDRATRLARRLFGVPVALVSLIDHKQRWFRSCSSFSTCETPCENSFCGHTLLGDEVLVLSDTLEDQRFVDNPLVLGDAPIRFYAGCPLRSADGSKIGSLTIMDYEPRDLGGDDLESLQDLAVLIEKEICAVQLATLDELTRISNRRGFEALGRQALESCRRSEKQASLLFFDLDKFKQINDRFGHKEGDRALITFARTLHQTFRDSDVIGRLSGDEFAVLLTDIATDEIRAALERLREAVAHLNDTELRGYDLRYSCGGTEFNPELHKNICELIAEADQRMYHHKRRRHGHGRRTARSR